MEVQQFINSLKDKSPHNIRSQIYKRGVLASYDSNDGRMVFYTSKNQRFTYADKLKLECNGLVYDTQNMKPLVIPPLTHRSNINTHIVNMHLSNGMYDILYADDGTVINLYWWEPDQSWHISTARSYDLTNRKWVSLTYKEVLQHILKDKTDEFYNLLDKEKSYTFGIKHEDSHPFWEGKEDPINKIWFIQSTNIETNEPCYEFLNDLGIPTQEHLEEKVGNVRDLFANLNKALDEFIVSKKRPLYGYILRSKDPQVTGAHGNILLESTLMQKIRQLYYHSSLNITSQEMSYDRNTFILVYSYLDANRHILFNKLFPQYKPSFKKLDEITSTLVRRIIAYSKNKKNEGYTTFSNKVQLYIKVIYDAFNSQFTVKPNDRNMVKLITTYLLTEKWVNMYYNLFTMEQ